MSRNAITEVTVLSTSCQVSTLWNSQIVGTQTATRIADIVKKEASLTNRDAVSAKRSNRVRRSPTSVGRSAMLPAMDSMGLARRERRLGEGVGGAPHARRLPQNRCDHTHAMYGRPSGRGDGRRWRSRASFRRRVGGMMLDRARRPGVLVVGALV